MINFVRSTSTLYVNGTDCSNSDGESTHEKRKYILRFGRVYRCLRRAASLRFGGADGNDTLTKS